MKILHLLITLASAVMLSCIGFAAGETDKSPTWTYPTDGPVDSISISSDGNHFAAGSQSVNGGTVYYFDNQKNLLWKYTTDRHVWSVAISDNGLYVAAAASKYAGMGAGHSYAGLVYLFDSKGNLLWKYDTNQTTVTEVKMSSDGSYLAVDTTNGILLLDKNGNLLWSHNDTSTNDHPVRITRDGALVATKDYNKLRVFDRNGTLLWERTEGDSGGAFAFSDDGRLLVTSAEPSGIDLLDRNGKLIWKDEVGMHFISTSISENDSYVEASAQGWGQDNAGGLFLFGNNAQVLWQLPGDGISAISSDGSYVAMGLWAYQGPSVLLYDNQGNLLWKHTSGLVHSLAISHDSKYVLIGIGDSNYGDGSVQIFTNVQGTESQSSQNSNSENQNSPVMITQVELDNPLALFPDNQTCSSERGFDNQHTCLTDLIPDKKVQCAYFLGSSTCEPIHQNTGGTNRSCLDLNVTTQAPQWFDMYNTQNKTLAVQLFNVQTLQNMKSWGEESYVPTSITLGPYEKCTYGFGPVDEPLTLDQTNMSFAVSYTYNGKNYTVSSPPLTDIQNDSRTWQFDGKQWIFAEQNTVTVPEFPFAVLILLVSITSSIVFYRIRIRK